MYIFKLWRIFNALHLTNWYCSWKVNRQGPGIHQKGNVKQSTITNFQDQIYLNRFVFYITVLNKLWSKFYSVQLSYETFTWKLQSLRWGKNQRKCPFYHILSSDSTGNAQDYVRCRSGPSTTQCRTILSTRVYLP